MDGLLMERVRLPPLHPHVVREEVEEQSSSGQVVRIVSTSDRSTEPRISSGSIPVAMSESIAMTNHNNDVNQPDQPRPSLPAGPADNQPRQSSNQGRPSHQNVFSSRQSLSTTIPHNVPFPPAHSHNHQNRITTTKYTLITFIPLNLLFQFRRFYNIYFLLGALSVIGGYSSLSPSSQIMPLVIVLAFSAAKEAIEDFNRYRADNAANNMPYTVIRNAQETTVLSMNISPGDILLISKGQKLPVDAIILSSSYEDGSAFVETAELDGETNLKRRSSIPSLAHIQSHEQAAHIKGAIQCERPNDNLNTFDGRISLSQPSQSLIPVTMNNLVLRGAVLRNTDSIYALVVYTGSNTRIIKNLKQGGLKSSTLEHRLNWLVIYAFIFNAFLLITSVLFEYWHYSWALGIETNRKNTNPADYAVEWYIGPRSTSSSFHTIATAVSFFSLYTYVIPISLFVSLELTRLAQAIYMALDTEMAIMRQEADGTVTQVPMRTNNSNLNEDLGCVEYIFSDKTGTLTQNSMRMAKWFIDGFILDELSRSGAVARAIRDFPQTYPSIPQQSKDNMLKLLIALGLCHGVIPSFDERINDLIYESQSPDETALLIGAKNNSVKLIARSKAGIDLEVFGAPHRYELLHTLEFSSTRKRMSVVIRTDHGIILYTKGADNVIMERIATSPPPDTDPSCWANSPDRIQAAKDALTNFSNEGLRTLVIAYRYLDEDTYSNFKTQLEEAENSLHDREGMLESAYTLVECELHLIGCTAIEDRLQDLVPETIEYLLQSGIKLWLLTGDKQETAINIGMSSRLINNHMRLIILRASSRSDSVKEIDGYLHEMHEDPSRIYALVVNGDVLTHALSGTVEHRQKFLELGTKCHSVICTRVSPLQKSLVVRLVRSSLKSAITLAIGDGANDVSMIQEAHIGVGIMGKEGTQAVRASDYAFGEFRFLQRLLSVHGRYNYLRICNIIFYSFYKNLVFITVQWWFGFFNAWSGQTVYEEIFFISFNVIYTSLPPLMYAIFERDISPTMIQKYPRIYSSIRTQFWSPLRMASWFVTSMLHSVFIFFTVYLTNTEGIIDVNGRSTGYWVQTYLFSTPLLISVTTKLIVTTRTYLWPTTYSIILSILINIVIMFFLPSIQSIIYSDVDSATMTHVLPIYYLLCLLMPAVCNVPDVIGLYGMGLINPSDTVLAMEEQYVLESRNPKTGVTNIA